MYLKKKDHRLQEAFAPFAEEPYVTLFKDIRYALGQGENYALASSHGLALQKKGITKTEHQIEAYLEKVISGFERLISGGINKWDCKELDGHTVITRLAHGRDKVDEAFALRYLRAIQVLKLVNNLLGECIDYNQTLQNIHGVPIDKDDARAQITLLSDKLKAHLPIVLEKLPWEERTPEVRKLYTSLEQPGAIRPSAQKWSLRELGRSHSADGPCKA